MALTSLDEFINAPDLLTSIDTNLALAKAAKARMQIEIRSTPAGAPSQQEGVFTVDPETTTAAQVQKGLELKLMQSPGEDFCGQLRLNFRPAGESANPFGSHTRHIMPPQVSQSNAWEEREKAMFSWVFRFASLNAEQTKACAELVKALNPQLPSSWGPAAHILTSLGTKMLAPQPGTLPQGAQQYPQQNPQNQPVLWPPYPPQGAPAYQALPATTTSTSPPATAALPESRQGSGSTELNREAVRQWALSNPSEAQQLVMELAPAFVGSMEP